MYVKLKSTDLQEELNSMVHKRRSSDFLVGGWRCMTIQAHEIMSQEVGTLTDAFKEKVTAHVKEN